MAGPLDIANLWKILGTKGNQMNPAVAAQLAQQASQPEPVESPSPADIASIPPHLRAPGTPGIPPMLDAQMPMAQPPPEPKVVPVQSDDRPRTATPTYSPTGMAPQELVPSQPALADASNGTGLQPSQLDWMKQYLLANKPTISPEMERQMALADKNSADSISRQDAAVEDQKKLYAQYAKADRGIDFRPLAALSDSLYGSKLSQAAQDMAPESAAQKMQHQMEMLKGITAGTAGLTKDQLDYVKQKLQQQSYVENRNTKNEIAKNADLTKLAVSGNGTGFQKQRIGNQQDRIASQAADKFDNDSLIKKSETMRQQIDLDKHTLDTATVLTPQIFNEIQIGLANAISGGRSAAVSTQDKVEFSSLEQDYLRLKQRVTNKPEDINSPEVRAMLASTMDRLSDAYKGNAYSRAKQIREGRAAAYANNPAAIKVMDAKVNAYKPQGAKPEVMIQDGHTYNLNHTTGEYE